MKQAIKDYLCCEVAVIAIILIFCIGFLPILYIDNVLFAILYSIIVFPLITLGVYKIVITLLTKIVRL